MIDTAQLIERVDRISAERDQLLDALKRVLKLQKSIEYRTANEQAVLRGANALVVECEQAGKR